jgi:hypothetical protein
MQTANGPRVHTPTLISSSNAFKRCSGQGKTDAEASNCGYRLEVSGTDIPERRVPPRAIVEHLAGSDPTVPRFLTRGLVTQSRALARYAP